MLGRVLGGDGEVDVVLANADLPQDALEPDNCSGPLVGVVEGWRGSRNGVRSNVRLREDVRTVSVLGK